MLDQQQRYFYIDRKFGSGNLSDINDALDDLDLFLKSITKMNLADSLVVRLKELIPTTKSLPIKFRIAHIFQHHSQLIQQLPSRNQIIFYLAHFIKIGDQLTRIASLRILKALIGAQCKDISVYHILLSKLSQNSNVSNVEKKEAITCLAKLLSISAAISKNFTKDISQLTEIYNIPLKIILYLLTYSIIDCHQQKRLLQELSQLLFTSKPSSKRELYYFGKLLLKFASHNYLVVQYFQTSDLGRYLSGITHQVKKIKRMKFSFLEEKKGMGNEKPQSVPQLIDQLYMKKKEGRLHHQYQLYQQKIFGIVENVKDPESMKSVLLLLYFSEDTFIQFDRSFKKFIVNSQVQSTPALFKQLTVVGCFESASFALSCIDIPQLNYIFLRSYLEFKSQKQPKNIENFKTISEIVSPELRLIVQTWQTIDKMTGLIILTGSWEQINLLQLALKNAETSLSQNWHQVTAVIKVFRTMKEGDTLQILKKKCYSFLPSSIRSTSSFWFAHFNKQSITKLLTMVF